MLLFDCLFKMVKNRASSSHLTVLITILEFLKEERVDEGMIAKLVSIIPQIYSEISIYPKDKITNCIRLLIELNPSVYSYLRDYLMLC